MHQPTIMCDDFVYEEGEDLDEDELKANAANLPKTLQALPGSPLIQYLWCLYARNVLLVEEEGRVCKVLKT